MKKTTTTKTKSQRMFAMAMAAAMNADETIKMSREMKEQQESIKFWTLYNGTLLEDIKNGK